MLNIMSESWLTAQFQNKTDRSPATVVAFVIVEEGLSRRGNK
jgi:hypothetical protein